MRQGMMAMADMVCGHTGNRDETLVAYLYDDIDPIERASFDAHLTSCERCRAELADLGVVRQRLVTWAPPTFVGASDKSPVAGRGSHVANPEASATGRQSWWREIPAWAQVAAALLFLGVSAGIANLDIRYDSTGLTVRTGWQQPSRDMRPGEASRNTVVATRSASSIGVASPASPAQEHAPWRADLA